MQKNYLAFNLRAIHRRRTVEKPKLIKVLDSPGYARLRSNNISEAITKPKKFTNSHDSPRPIPSPTQHYCPRLLV